MKETDNKGFLDQLKGARILPQEIKMVRTTRKEVKEALVIGFTVSLSIWLLLLCCS